MHVETIGRKMVERCGVTLLILSVKQSKLCDRMLPCVEFHEFREDEREKEKWHGSMGSRNKSGESPDRARDIL